MTHKDDEQTANYPMLTVRDAFTSDKSVCTLMNEILGKLSISRDKVFVETANLH